MQPANAHTITVHTSEEVARYVVADRATNDVIATGGEKKSTVVGSGSRAPLRDVQD